jgi:hypothetical protein
MVKITEKYVSECIKWLNALQNFESESAHNDADQIILSFCPSSVVEAWKNIDKWYA